MEFRNGETVFWNCTKVNFTTFSNIGPLGSESK
jgi:hypothetical protein